MESRDQMLIAEEAAKHKAKDRGKYAHTAENPAQPQALDLIQEHAQRNEHQPLAHIAVHNAEQNGIGNGHQERGIKLVIGGQSVHLCKGLEQAGPEVVFQLDRGRFHLDGRRGVLRQHHIRELSGSLTNAGKLFGGNPTAEQEGAVFGLDCVFFQLSGGIHKPEVAVEGQQLLAADLLPPGKCVLGLLQVLLAFGGIGLQHFCGILRGTGYVIGQPHPLKAKGIHKPVRPRS